MLGYLADGEDKSLAADVNSYFASTVADAKRMADKRPFFDVVSKTPGGPAKRSKLNHAKQDNESDATSSLSMDAKSNASDDNGS